jgi:hypothetical protein
MATTTGDYDPRRCTREALAWVPPMLGLDDELVVIYPDGSGLSTHYTGLYKDKRVFVFSSSLNENTDKWYVVVDRPDVNCVSVRFNNQQPGDVPMTEKERNAVYMPADPVLLLGVLEQLTSEGN